MFSSQDMLTRDLLIVTLISLLCFLAKTCSQEIDPYYEWSLEVWWWYLCLCLHGFVVLCSWQELLKSYYLFIIVLLNESLWHDTKGNVFSSIHQIKSHMYTLLLIIWLTIALMKIICICHYKLGGITLDRWKSSIYFIIITNTLDTL